MAAGIAIGLVGALALTRSLTALLFGVRATDVRVYVGVSLFSLRGAPRRCDPVGARDSVDPISALR